MRRRAADHRRHPARDARPGPLRRLAAVARPPGVRGMRRAEPHAAPHGEQRLFPPDHERYRAAGAQRGGRQGGRSGLGTLPPIRRGPRRPGQGTQAQAAGRRGPGGAQRRRCLRRDPVPQGGRRHNCRQVGQAGRVRDAGQQQGGDRLGQARRRLLRPDPPEEALESALDEGRRARGPGASAAGSQRPRRIHEVRVVVARTFRGSWRSA